MTNSQTWGRRRWRRFGERFVGADPGLNQLRMAVEVVGGVVIAAALVSVLVRSTGALQVAAGSVPEDVRHATNERLLVMQMLVAGLMALTAGFVVNDTARGPGVRSTVLLLASALPTLAVSLALGSYRIASLVFLVLLLMASVYVRRWGARGAAAGVSLFQAGLVGFVLHDLVGGLTGFGWLTVDTALGVVASLIIRFGIVRDTPEKTLIRMRRAWRARAGDLLDLGADALHLPARPGADHRDEVIRRQVVRLNEATLIVEGQLVITWPGGVRREAQELFAADLALTNTVRFCAVLSHGLTARDETLRADVASALAAAREERWDELRELARALRARSDVDSASATLVHRFGLSLRHYAEARERLHAAVTTGSVAEPGATTNPAPSLAAGFLPGSAVVSATASTTPGPDRFERTTMPPYLRSTIQIGVATALAVGFGNLVDGSRVYWAVLTTYLAFMSTNNTVEEVRKALSRVIGTGLGIVAGELVVHATGGRTAIALPVAVVVLLAGLWSTRTNYILTVVGVTMIAALIYVDAGSFSWDLLVARLIETAVGVGAVSVAVVVVFPLRPQRVFTAGEQLWFRALSTLLDDALSRLLGATTPGGGKLPADIGALDAAWASFETAALPLRYARFGRLSTRLTDLQTSMSAARYQARSLATVVDHLDGPTDTLPALDEAARQFRASAAVITARLTTGRRGGTYRPAAALVDAAARTAGDAPGETLTYALDDLRLLDASLARLARVLDVRVAEDETAAAREPAV